MTKNFCDVCGNETIENFLGTDGLDALSLELRGKRLSVTIGIQSATAWTENDHLCESCAVTLVHMCLKAHPVALTSE